MFLTYLEEVVKRTFTPASRLTDGLQIAVASAIPAAATFAGIDVPDSVEVSALAYIGLVALALFVIRLIWAPYAMWKAQNGEIGELKLELSKPERIEAEVMARRRAQKRIKLAAFLRQSQLFSTSHKSQEALDSLVKSHIKAVKIMAEAGIEPEVQEKIGALLSFMHASLLRERADRGDYTNLMADAVGLVCLHCHGSITAANLLRQWPSGIE